MIVNERITAYINSLDRGNGSLCDEVEEEAVSSYVPIIRKETSALLKTLVAMKRPERILEVGTAVGYSALLMSRVMPENCHITTIEKYEKRIPIAKENFIRAGLQIWSEVRSLLQMVIILSTSGKGEFSGIF